MEAADWSPDHGKLPRYLPRLRKPQFLNFTLYFSEDINSQALGKYREVLLHINEVLMFSIVLCSFFVVLFFLKKALEATLFKFNKVLALNIWMSPFIMKRDENEVLT